VTAKSNDFKSLFGNESIAIHRSNTGMHFVFSNSNVTSSEAILPIYQIQAAYWSDDINTIVYVCMCV